MAQAPKPKYVKAIPWAIAFMDVMIRALTDPANAARKAHYRAEHAYRSQPAKPGKGHRASPATSQRGRLSFKRLEPWLGSVEMHKVGEQPATGPNLSLRKKRTVRRAASRRIAGRPGIRATRVWIDEAA